MQLWNSCCFHSRVFQPCRDVSPRVFFSLLRVLGPKTLAQQQSGRADVLTDVGVCCVSRAAVSMVQFALPRPAPPRPPPPPSLQLHCGPFQPPPLWGPLSPYPEPSNSPLFLSLAFCVGRPCPPLFRYVGCNLSVHARPQPQPQPRTHTHAHTCILLP